MLFQSHRSQTITPEFIDSLSQKGRVISEKEALTLAEIVIHRSRAPIELRQRAAVLLEATPFRTVALTIVPFVSKGDDESRVIAAKALAKTNFPTARDALIEAIGLSNNAPNALAMRAAESLRPVHDEQEINRLKVILEKRGGIYAGGPANAVCNALTGTHSQKGIDVLLDLTLNPYSSYDHRPGKAIHYTAYRWGIHAAAEALSKTDISSEIVSKLITRAEDTSLTQRYYAIQALNQRTEQEAQESLKRIALNDPNAENRSAAARGIIVKE